MLCALMRSFLDGSDRTLITITLLLLFIAAPLYLDSCTINPLKVQSGLLKAFSSVQKYTV
jgi:hypothetical protein